MGSSSSKIKDEEIKKKEKKTSNDKENVYFNAYKRIKRIHQDIHNKMIGKKFGIVEDVYLIKISTNSEYLKILKKWKILEEIAKLQPVNNLEEKMKNDFEEYKLEKTLDCIDTINYNFQTDETFIIVDEKFNQIMKISYRGEQKVNLNVNENEINIKLPNEDIFIIEETEKGNGIYKFVEIIKKEDDYNALNKKIIFLILYK